MKRLLMILLCLLMLSGCGKKDSPVDTGEKLPVNQAAEQEIRNALSMLIDRNYIAQSIGQAGQTPADGFVPMGMLAYYKGGFYDLERYEENYANAISILRKYYKYDEKTGKFLDFPNLTYLYNNAESHKAVGEYLQALYAGIGIQLRLENQEWNTFLSTRAAKEYDIARNGWVADHTDPSCFLELFISSSGNNDIGFGTGAHKDAKLFSVDLTDLGYDMKVENGTWAETYDVLMELARTNADEQVRYELLHRAEKLLMQTGAVCPIYFDTDVYMLSDKVSGFYENPLGNKYFAETTLKGGGDISVCLASEPESMDPGLCSTVDGATMLSHLFAGLSRWTAEGTVAADCAEELPEPEILDDGRVRYTYTLKDGLTWSDGSTLTAGDFVYAWDRAASPNLGSDYGYLMDVVEKATALDDRSLEVILKGNIPYWNEMLAFPTFFPVKQGLPENWAANADTFVCNGAYTMDSWRHDSLIALKKRPGADGRVTMDKIHFYLSDDANNMLTNFKNGTWQLIDSVPTNEIAMLKKQYPREFKTASKLSTYYICFNINRSLKPKV